MKAPVIFSTEGLYKNAL